MPAARWPEMYGTNYCPAIRSLTVGIAVLSTACAPDVMGWLISAAVGLEQQYLIFCGYVFICALGFVLVLRSLWRPHLPPSWVTP